MATRKKAGGGRVAFLLTTFGATIVIVFLCLFIRSLFNGDGEVTEEDDMFIAVMDEEESGRKNAKEREMPEVEKVRAQQVVAFEESSGKKIQKVRESFEGLHTDFLSKYHPKLNQEIFHACLAMRESSGDRRMVGDAGEHGYFQIDEGALEDLNKKYGESLTLEDFRGPRANQLAVWAFSAHCNKYVPESKKGDMTACLNVWHRGPGAWNWGSTDYTKWVNAHYKRIRGSSDKENPKVFIANYPDGFYINPLPDGYRKTRGVGNGHMGQDLAAPEGSRVVASSRGKVIFAGKKTGFGNCVYIYDGYAIVIYGHLSQINVEKGDGVRQGELIGKVGNTGRSRGNHLHIEFRKPKKGFRTPKF